MLTQENFCYNAFERTRFGYELTRRGTINRFSPRGISPITALLELVKETAADLGRLERLATRRLRVCYHHSYRSDRNFLPRRAKNILSLDG